MCDCPEHQPMLVIEQPVTLRVNRPVFINRYFGGYTVTYQDGTVSEFKDDGGVFSTFSQYFPRKIKPGNDPLSTFIRQNHPEIIESGEEE